MSPRAKRSGPRRRKREIAQRARRACRLETLEPRQMLAVNVVQPMGEQAAWEDGHDTLIDLRTVFESDLDQPLTYKLVGNTNEILADATLDAWALRVKHNKNQHGTAEITVQARGTIDQESAVDAMHLTIRPVNDPPALLKGLPEIIVDEGAATTLDLTQYFQDVEQSAAELQYFAVPFDASEPANPVAAVRVENGILSLDTTNDVYGYAEYAISAMDREGARVAATLYVFVKPVNDPPTARRMPDRSHATFNANGAPLVAIDLWYQHLYDDKWEPYFSDVEDGPYLNYAVSVDNPDVFQMVPYVDVNSFLLYCPTSVPGFYGSAVVTITARDREGVVARLADGSLPTFTVRVDNRSTIPWITGTGDAAGAYGPARAGGNTSGSNTNGPDVTAVEPNLNPDPNSGDPGAGVPGGGGAGPDDPPLDNPPDPDTPPNSIDAFVNLEVLKPRVSEDYEQSPGALVALNNDYDERNVGTTTIVVGPNDREVDVLSALRDNQPDRIPEQGRQHHIAVSWQWCWDSLSDQPWEVWGDDDVRPARVVVSGPGSVSFEVPAGVRLWIPAWALYGGAAFSHGNYTRHIGARWIEVRQGEHYRIDDPDIVGIFNAMGNTLPLAIEGMDPMDGEIVARYTPAAVNTSLEDAVNIAVVSVDLDVDSDNTNQLQLPDRSAEEERLEDQRRDAGKRLVVNADDADRDNVPDFLDGFNLDEHVTFNGQPSLADDRVELTEHVGFVPVVVELPARIDPSRALLRFTYAASDPAAATMADDGSRQLAPGGIRMWTVDEFVPRSPHAADDPAGPGHFIAPYVSFQHTHPDPDQSDATYTVGQLTGDPSARQFTVYLEGVRAGQSTIGVFVDPDGIPFWIDDGAGRQAPSYPDLFTGFLLHDSVRVTVESEVTIAAVNAIGAESDDAQRQDAVQFEINRGRYDTQSGLVVFFRLHTLESGAAPATDPTVDPSRSDYRVSRSYAAYETGLADDPYTRIGSVWIPDGNCSATLTVVAENDAVVEWDESVAIELIEWDEYRRLHDQILDVTPNDGLPGGPYLPDQTTYRSPYRLNRDEQGKAVDHVGIGTLLDNDALTSRVARRPDAESIAEEVATISHGLVDVDLHDGDARIVLPLWGPTYRENDNLRAVVEIVLQLPPCDVPISRLTGVYTIGGRSGEIVEFDVAGLQAYLDANPLRDLRLVIPGPLSLSDTLATGHYDDDVVLTAYLGDRTLTRTVRGSLEVINRVNDELGGNEFGNRWWLDELDRVVPGDGITSQGATAASRLGSLGARTDSGITLVRGDNSSDWFAASQVAPGTVMEINDAENGHVTFSDPADWIGNVGERGGRYRTSIAGLQDREAYAAWHFATLRPGRMYQVYVHWDADPQLASNAVYEVLGGEPVAGGAGIFQINQRFVPGEHQTLGRAWRSLGFFTPSSDDNSMEVRLTTVVGQDQYVDGLVSAGAVMLVDQWDFSPPPSSASKLEIDPTSGAVQVTTKQNERYEFAAATGLLEWRQDRHGNRTEYHYLDADEDGRPDELNRIVRQGGLATTFRYIAGKLVSITDFAGRVTQWNIENDQVRAVTGADPGSDAVTPKYSFAYTAADGLVTQVKDPRGYSSRIQRDVQTRRVSRVVNPDGYSWSIRPYLADGIAGELRLPSHGRIGARSMELAGLAEARARYEDPRGNVWEYQTDRYGLLIAEAKPAVPGSPQRDVWQWVRDDRGLPLRAIVPPGGGGDTPLPAITTRQEYDAAGDLLKRIFADGTYEQWTYDPVFHQVRSYRDRLGRRTGYTLDARGNVILQIEYGSSYVDTPDRRTRFTYSTTPESIDKLPGGLVTRVVTAADSADAVTTEQEHYTTGLQVGLLRAIHSAVGVTDPDVAATTQFTYDGRRNLITEIDALGRATSFVYDNLDRLVQQKDPSPGTGDHLPPLTTYRYDAAGNVTLTIDPRGVRTVQAFDPLNRLTSTVMSAPGGHAATDQTPPTTRYRYDADGNLVRETDPLNRTTEYAYDARSQNTLIKHPATRISTLPVPPEPVAGRSTTYFDYDTLGDLRSVTDARGAITSYAYDAWRRPTRETSPAPGTGQHSAAVTERVYDAAGQLLEVRESGENQWRVTDYTYDNLGRVRSEILPTDMAGRRPTTCYTYDLRDNLRTETQPNGSVVVHQYDQQDRLRGSTLPDPDGAGPLGEQVTARQYNVDGTLRVESQWDARDPTSVLATSYSYDQLGRTTRVVQADPDGGGSLPAPETTYRYDVMGNRTVESERLDQDRVRVRTTLYDNLNRAWKTIETVSGRAVREEINVYDRAGQVVRRLEGGADGTAAVAYRQFDYAFDERGRLVMRADPMPAAGAVRPVTYFYYDTVGNLRFERNAAGCWTEYESDALKRLVAVIEPATEDLVAPVTRFEYTITGDLRSTVDPLGRRSDFAYDNSGREVLRRLPSVNGQVPEARTVYDVMGNVISTLDSDGNSTRTEYDVLNRPLVVMENGITRRYTYDGLGRVATDTDGAGEKTRYGYDQLGRRTVVIPPHPAGRDPFDQTRDDDAASFQGEWQAASGGFQAGHHFVAGDTQAEVVATWSFAGLFPGATYEVLATWDAHPGNSASADFRISDAGGPIGAAIEVNQQQIAADVMDQHRAWQRLATVTVAGDVLYVELEPSSVTGRVVADGVRVVEVFGATYTTYDLAGNVVSQTDGLGNTTRYTYDERSHRTSVTDANGHTTRFAYDPLGRLTSVVDPLGNVTAYSYDDLDRVTREYVQWEGAVYSTAYQYDVRGNVQGIVDRLGRTRTFRYDALGRLREEIWYESTGDAVADRARANTIQRQYDLVGKLTAVRDDFSAYTFSYDTLDREVSVLADLPGVPEVLLVNDYVRHDDLRCRLTAWVGSQHDFETRFTYGRQGLLRRLEQSGPGVSDKRIDFSYTPTQQFARLDRFEDLVGRETVVTSVYQYDDQGRISGLIHQQGSSVLAGYQWGLDPAGRVARFVSVQDGAVDYRYDAGGQLLRAYYADRPDESYAYDANGNRVAEGIVVGQRNQVESDGTFHYEYDAQGNRIKRTEIATGAVTEYRWDLLNRLVEIVERTSGGGPETRSIAYSYDVFGRRVGKAVAPAVGPTEAERYVYDGQHIALRFVQGRLANRYLHGPAVDQILADEQIDADSGRGTVLWPLADNLGTVRDVVDYDTANHVARVANHIVYDAFGNVIDETAAAVDHLFGFTGREDDEQSDLDFYRARYYDPGLGRFLSEDPIGFDSGDANLYRYVKNSPTNKVDPTGCYDQDVHFYFNYYLARYLGLDQPSGWINSRDQPISEALVISYFATRVDYDAQTRPAGAGVRARSLFHFPDPDDKLGVRERDCRVRGAIREVAGAGDLEMFGILTHVFQDSFSHRGFGDVWGHLRASDGLYSPDEPFRDSAREQRMARAAYADMVRLLMARRGIAADDTQAMRALLRGRSFNDFWNRTAPTLLVTPTADDAKVFASDRVAAWQELIARDFRRAAPRFNDTMALASTPMARRSRRVAVEVPAWYSRDYNHHAHWGNWQPVRHTQPFTWSTMIQSIRSAWAFCGTTSPRPARRPTPPTEWRIEWFPPIGQPKF